MGLVLKEQAIDSQTLICSPLYYHLLSFLPALQVLFLLFYCLLVTRLHLHKHNFVVILIGSSSQILIAIHFLFILLVRVSTLHIFELVKHFIYSQRDDLETFLSAFTIFLRPLSTSFLLSLLTFSAFQLSLYLHQYQPLQPQLS